MRWRGGRDSIWRRFLTAAAQSGSTPSTLPWNLSVQSCRYSLRRLHVQKRRAVHAPVDAISPYSSAPKSLEKGRFDWIAKAMATARATKR